MAVGIGEILTFNRKCTIVVGLLFAVIFFTLIMVPSQADDDGFTDDASGQTTTDEMYPEDTIEAYAGTLTNVLQTAGVAQADIITVCSSGCDYTSIQEAIDNANDGDTIEVHSGTYYENVRVNKELTIISESGNPDDTIVQTEYPGDEVFYVISDNVTINGFKVTGATSSLTYAIDLHNIHNCSIFNNKILDNWLGIWFSGSSNNTVANNIISNSGWGIYVGRSSNNNKLNNNSIISNQNGIYLEDTNNHTLNDNNFINNGLGINLYNSTNNNISGNNFAYNTIYGIYLQDSNDNHIYANNFINNNNNANSSYSINNWNSTEPITYQYNGSTFINYVGNYWSDYTGSDLYSDGIGDTPYEINNSAGVQDKYPLIEPWEGVDLALPYVTITSPANLATNVKINTDITATFSEPMDSSTLNNSTVKVYSFDKIVGETFEDINGSWNSSNFQAFNHSEELTVWQTPIDDTHRTIGEHNLTYTTHSILRDYQLYSNEGIKVEYSGNYSVIGWLGNENVVIDYGTGDWIISKLVFEQNSTDTKTLHVGETWDLEDGYSFKLVELDIYGNEAWMALKNSSGKIENQVCQNQSACIFSTDLGAFDKSSIFVTYLNKVNYTHIELKYTWLISQDAAVINLGESFGVFEVKSISSDTIRLANDENVSLTRGSGIPLANNLNFEVEDTPNVRYCLVGTGEIKTGLVGDISYDSASKTVTFDPVSDLVYDINYISYITTGAEDLAGNGLMEDYIWTFETTNYTAGDIPQITDFKVEPNTSVNVNNPAIASAYITDEDLNLVYFELFDSNGLIDTNNIMLWWYQNESGINGKYFTPPWYANAWSVTNDTIQDVVTIGYPTDSPDNGILFGIFKKNNTAGAEEALLWFNLTTGNLTNITRDDIDRTPLSIETGISIVRIFNLKLAIIPFVEGSTFTLYTIGDPNNLHIVSIPVPTGAYQALVTANDTAGNVNVLWADIEVDNTPPNAIAIMEYPSGTAASNGSITTLNVSADDNMADIRNVSADVSAVNSSGYITLTRQGNYWIGNITVIAVDGKHLINITVMDNAFNVKKIQINVTMDSTPPNITITKPANNSIVYTPTITVFGNVTDNMGIMRTLFTHDCAIEWVKEGESGGGGGGGGGGGSPLFPTNISINQPVTLWEGWNWLTFNCTDIAGNTAIKSINVKVEPPYINSSVNTTANNVTVLDDALEKVDAIIELVTSNDTTSGTVTMMISNATPMQLNQSFGMDALGKYVYINLSDSLNDSISWAIIKIFYTQSELETSGLDENSLVLRHYNETLHIWESLTPSGVNTTDVGNYSGYVWANVSHFSYYGIAGEEEVEDTSGGNGGGGGGGSGTSGEDFYNIVQSETDRQSVFKNSSVSFIFDMEGNIVRHINFTALKSAGTVAAKVEILNNTSTLVSTPPPDEVYKNLNLWVGNAGWATKRNIADVTVVFTVDKSWINENNIDESSIALYRYSDDTWHELVTMKIAEDANSLQFEAETPGFSPFAVTGKEFEREAGGEDIIAEPTVTAEKTPAQTPTEKKGIPGFGLFAGLSVLLIAVQLLRKKK